MNIYIHSVTATNGDSARIARLLDYYELKHRINIIDSPSHSDIILLVDIDPTDTIIFPKLMTNPFSVKYPEKTFVLSEWDIWPEYYHGVFSSASHSCNKDKRFASCGYALTQLQWGIREISTEKYKKPKKWLYSFVGRDACSLRNKLFEIHSHHQNDDILIENVLGHSGFYTASEADKNYMREYFLEVMAQSYFSLCPRGVGLGSVRLFETMEMGVAPVVIADDWLPCYGPDWSKFCVFIKEKDIINLNNILRPIKDRAEEMGDNARKEWEKWFAKEKYFGHIIYSIDCIKKQQVKSEKYYSKYIYLTALKYILRYMRIRASINSKQILKFIVGERFYKKLRFKYRY